ERDTEGQVRAGLVLHLLDRPLRDRLEALRLQRLAVRVADDPLHRLVLDRRPVFPLQHVRRDLPLAEARQLQPLRQPARDLAPLPLHALRGDRDDQTPRPRARLLDRDLQVRRFLRHSAPGKVLTSRCERGDSNPHGRGPRDPKSRASTSSATFASRPRKSNSGFAMDQPSTRRAGQRPRPGRSPSARRRRPGRRPGSPGHGTRRFAMLVRPSGASSSSETTAPLRSARSAASAASALSTGWRSIATTRWPRRTPFRSAGLSRATSSTTTPPARVYPNSPARASVRSPNRRPSRSSGPPTGPDTCGVGGAAISACVSLTSNLSAAPYRITSTATTSPGSCCATTRWSVPTRSTFRPFTATITSPRSRPDRCAGEPGGKSTTST